MSALKRTAAGTVLGGAMLVAGGLSLAHAAPPVPEAVSGDGQVDITVTANGQQVGVIDDVALVNAAGLATSVCPGAGIDQGALTRFDDGGAALPACNGMVGGLSFAFSQDAPDGDAPDGDDGPGNSENAPGQNRDAEATPPSVAPTTPGQQGR